MPFLAEAAIYLAAAVIAVPLAKRFGMGSILGYLIAGSIIGPWGFGLIFNVDDILHFAELGIIILLFLIGLELQPARLWTMRRLVFGLGGSQVGISAVLITAISIMSGQSWQVSLIIGLALALSSTAFALQMLGEKGLLPTRFGRSAFSVLLFQDVAAIPIIALVPFLAIGNITGEGSLTWIDGLTMIGTIIGIVVIGKFMLRHLFHWVAGTGIRELFTACGLLTILGAALIMYTAGLSMALGAFLAGVLLADSEYRHAIEADILPFKGLFLGLFFIAVGMSVNFGLLVNELSLVALLVTALIGIKVAVLYGLGRWSGLDHRAAGHLALAISQGGEFAFIIFNIAVDALVVPHHIAELLILVVTLSMAATPVLFLISEKLSGSTPPKPEKDEPFQAPENTFPVIIAGFGRFGQIIGRILAAKKIGFTALENDTTQVDFVKKFDGKVYYGDASRVDLLHAAGASKAQVFVLAIENIDRSLYTTEIVKKNFPNLKIIARARHRRHAHMLMDAGADIIIRETFHSSVEAGRLALEGIGMSPKEASHVVETFRDHDERMIKQQHGIYDDENRLVESARQWREELEQLFARDAGEEQKDK